jgi:hypothetical protein
MSSKKYSKNLTRKVMKNKDLEVLKNRKEKIIFLSMKIKIL